MFLVPLGPEEPLRRTPWVTLGVLALCLVVRLATVGGEAQPYELSGARMEINSIEKRAYERIFVDRGFGPLYVEGAERPYADQSPAQLVADLRAGKLVQKFDSLRNELSTADKALADLESRDPARRFGYRASEGASSKLLTATFVQTSWLRTIVDGFLLWCAAASREDRWGSPVFAAFYLLGTVVASTVFALAHGGDDAILAGTSGAVAASMGAFLVCFWRANVRVWWTVLLARSGVFLAPAYAVGAFWLCAELFATAVAQATGSISASYSPAFGGLLFGVGIAAALRFSGLESKLERAPESDAPDGADGLDFRRRATPHAVGDVAPERRSRPSIADDSASLGAPRERLRAAMERADRRAVTTAASELIARVGERFEWDDVTEIYTTVVASLPGTPLSDRALAMAVRAAIRAGQAPLALEIAARLLLEHPHSALLRGALWDLAALQESRGLRVIAPDALQRFSVAPPSPRA